jgi:hypothetical protein
MSVIFSLPIIQLAPTSMHCDEMPVTVRSGVVFGAAASGSGQLLLCDVYTPDEAAPAFPSLADGRRVGVLLIHGGVCRPGHGPYKGRRHSPAGAAPFHYD